jgi:hypothetical protein
MTPEEYVALGLRVVPLYGVMATGECQCLHRNKRTCHSPGKHPRVQWQDIEHVSLADIEKWKRWWPGCNWAVLTGRWGSAHLVVVDIDPRHGGDESAADLDLPDTWTVVTGSGGEHRWYISAAPVPSAAGVRPGVDIRGAGGLVVVPPSRHASGAEYVWDAERNPATMPEPARAPSWLGVTREPARVDLADLSELHEGQRNAGLTRVVGSIVAATDDPWVALERAHAANETLCRPPLPRDEVEGIVASVWRAEIRKLRARAAADAEDVEDIATVLGIPKIERVVRRASVGEHPYSWRLVLEGGRVVPLGHDILSWAAVSSALVNHVAASVPDRRPKGWASIAARLAAMAEDDVVEEEREIVCSLIRSAMQSAALVIEPSDRQAALAQGKLVKAGDYLLMMPRAFLTRARAERICDMSIRELHELLAATGWERRPTGEYAALAADYWAAGHRQDRGSGGDDRD